MGDFNGRGRGGGFRRGGGSFGGGFRRGGDFRREMHKAICSKCKKECEVPFKPTEGRPVYCKDCFAEVRDNPEAVIKPKKTSEEESEDFEDESEDEDFEDEETA